MADPGRLNAEPVSVAAPIPEIDLVTPLLLESVLVPLSPLNVLLIPADLGFGVLSPPPAGVGRTSREARGVSFILLGADGVLGAKFGGGGILDEDEIGFLDGVARGVAAVGFGPAGGSIEAREEVRRADDAGDGGRIPRAIELEELGRGDGAAEEPFEDEL